MLTACWRHLDLGDPGGLGVKLNSLGNPQPEQFVVGLSSTGQDTARVGDASRGFEQHQAGIGSNSIETPAFEIIRQAAVVGDGVIAAQTELEAVLAFGGSVTSARVAAHARHGRHDITHKADLVFLLDPLDLDRHGNGMPCHRGLNCPFAIRLGPDDAGTADGDHRGGGLQFGQAGQVDALAGIEGLQLRPTGCIQRVCAG